MVEPKLGLVAKSHQNRLALTFYQNLSPYPNTLGQRVLGLIF